MLDGARKRIVQRDTAAGRGHHLGDAGAHLTGADHEDVLQVHGAGAYPSRQ